MSKQLTQLLHSHRGEFHQLTPFNLKTESAYVFDLSDNNKELNQIDLNDEESFNAYIFDSLKNNGVNVGLGKYNEDRAIYKRSDVFSGVSARSIHLGIDIWAEAGTPIFSPIEGKVHSFKNNNNHADYGPTIILQHELEGKTFFTLYGHLSLDSITSKQIGQTVRKGEKFASFGEYEVNVHWPPHLHFQIIEDMQGKFGDYPGVSTKEDRKKYLDNSPDANLIVNAKELL